jgi:hypothetical protein
MTKEPLVYMQTVLSAMESCGTDEETILKVLRLPTVDAALVIRCKDCRYRDGRPGSPPDILCAQMHDMDYCSYGEPYREGEFFDERYSNIGEI